MEPLKLLLLLTGLFHSVYPTKSLRMDVISENPTLFGDSPHWSTKTQSLYYVDFFGVKFHICRFDYKQRRVYTALIENAPSNAAFIIPIEGRTNRFAVGFSDRTVKQILWDGKSTKARIMNIIFKVEQNPYYKDNVWHIGTTDIIGRFYGGTIRTQLCTRSTAADGSVYTFTESAGVRKQLEFVELSNGIAHSLRQRKVFHINACDFAVKAYDWNIATGDISNGKKIYQIYEKPDVPTLTGLGLAIDIEDNLYVARYNGSSIKKIDSSTGRELKTFNIPTAYTHNIAFGGPNMDEIFVVTGQLPFDIFTGKLKNETLTPTAGCLFILKDVGARGYPGVDLRLY